MNYLCAISCLSNYLWCTIDFCSSVVFLLLCSSFYCGSMEKDCLPTIGPYDGVSYHEICSGLICAAVHNWIHHLSQLILLINSSHFPPPPQLLLRFVDDFLLITRNQSLAREFYSIMSKGLCTVCGVCGCVFVFVFVCLSIIVSTCMCVYVYECKSACAHIWQRLIKESDHYLYLLVMQGYLNTTASSMPKRLCWTLRLTKMALCILLKMVSSTGYFVYIQ